MATLIRYKMQNDSARGRTGSGEHPEQHLAGFVGLMQADIYAEFNRLYEADRKPGPVIEAAPFQPSAGRVTSPFAHLQVAGRPLREAEDFLSGCRHGTGPAAERDGRPIRE